MDGQTTELSGLQFSDWIFLTFSIRFYKSFNPVQVAVVAFELQHMVNLPLTLQIDLLPPLHHVITLSVSLVHLLAM